MKLKLVGTSLAIVAGMAAAGMFATPIPASATETIRAVTFAPPSRNDLSMVMFREYMKRVNAAGKGVVKIDHIGGPEAVPLRDQVNAVGKGIADMVMTFTVHAALVPEVGTLGQSRIGIEEERKNGYVALLDEAHKKINIKFIGRAATNGGFYIFSKKAITDLADFKGMKIRSHSGYDPVFNALGATPVHMKISEIYTGLERGLVQAAPYPLFVSGLGLHKVIGYAMADSFWTAHTTMVLMNRKKFDGLPQAAKDVIINTQIALEKEMWNKAQALKDKERAKLEKSGVKFVSLAPAKAKAWIALTNDARWAVHKKKISGDNYNKIKSLIGGN